MLSACHGSLRRRYRSAFDSASGIASREIGFKLNNGASSFRIGIEFDGRIRVVFAVLRKLKLGLGKRVAESHDLNRFERHQKFFRSDSGKTVMNIDLRPYRAAPQQSRPCRLGLELNAQ